MSDLPSNDQVPADYSGKKLPGSGKARRFAFNEDVGDVTRLFERVFKKKANRELWKWKYLPPWVEEAYAWVAEIDGKIAGHLGAVPLRGQIKGEHTMFFQFGDIMTDTDFRSLDIYNHLNPTEVVRNIGSEWPKAVVYGFTGGQLSLWYSWFSSLGQSTHVESAKDRIIEVVAGNQSSGFSVEPWRWDQPELDELWLDLQDTTPIGLIRDRIYLDWRYKNHPIYEYELFGVYQDGEPIGWFVSTKPDDEKQSEDVIRIQDFLLPPEELIPAMKKAGNVLGARNLLLWMPDNALTSGIVSRNNGWKSMYYSLDNTITKNFIANRVFYSLGEVDQWWW